MIAEEHIDLSGADNRRFIDIGQRIRKGATLEDLLEDVERRAITEALTQADGDRAAAALLLGIDLDDLRQRLNGLDLD